MGVLMLEDHHYPVSMRPAEPHLQAR